MPTHKSRRIKDRYTPRIQPLSIRLLNVAIVLVLEELLVQAVADMDTMKHLMHSLDLMEVQNM